MTGARLRRGGGGAHTSAGAGGPLKPSAAAGADAASLADQPLPGPLSPAVGELETPPGGAPRPHQPGLHDPALPPSTRRPEPDQALS